ncbi:MAG: hypothetical protein KJP07_07130 [Desulfatitalea sp.]|nr:hypothetical protein [Desulfatitalea sp.]
MNQWQSNVIAAEEYIYENKNCPYVIVGSSLSATIDLPGLDYWNLAFAGGNSMTGLDIIIKSNATPKYVLYETNVFQKPDNNFTKDLLSPILWKIKSSIPSFRKKYQPLNIMFYLLDSFARRLKSATNKPAGQSINAAPSNENKTLTPELNSQDSLTEILIHKQFEDYQKLPDEKANELLFSKLKDAINILKERNIKVIFFEMPIHYELVDLPYPKHLREKFFENFPKDNHIWLDHRVDKKYKSIDGVHLDPPSAHQFSREIAQDVNKMIEK